MSDARGLADLLRDLVDTLIAGDQTWPAASVVGVQGVLAMRLLEIRGEAGVDELEQAVLSCGGPLANLEPQARTTVIEQLERSYPDLFTLIRNAAFLAYYEHPAVIRAIRSLGQPYQAVPIDTGYALPPFDLERDRPTHGRGHWLRTDEIRRLDLSGLIGADHG